MFVFDMADSSDMVQRGELFFGEMQAKVTLSPVMNLEDLRRGLRKPLGGCRVRCEADEVAARVPA